MEVNKRKQDSQSIYARQHLTYYVSHTIFTTICLGALGWHAFLSSTTIPVGASIVPNAPEAQVVMLCRICFWLQAATFVTNSFLGPFFQLGAPLKFKEHSQ